MEEKQCLTLYEQDMNEEAYCDGSGMDLISRTSDVKRECMGYDSRLKSGWRWRKKVSGNCTGDGKFWICFIRLSLTSGQTQKMSSKEDGSCML
jgi:hypothetical protein